MNDLKLHYNDISIVPEIVTDIDSRQECNPFIDGMLPIFASPMGSVLDESNWRFFMDHYINVVIPRTININKRLNILYETTGVVSKKKPFVSFSLNEAKDFILYGDSLDFVVETAVNSVGVNINSASIPLLTRVSGLNAKTAKLIVNYRDENGPFKTREDIKIKGIGAKTLEQAIGFLRIPNGTEKLDMTAIHPESYAVAEEILAKLGFTKDDIGSEKLQKAIAKLNRKEFIKQFNVGEYTFNDILDAFVAPLRDPRDKFDKPILRSDVLHLEDLAPGMELQGTVRNVVDFGAFVDCGVKEDGLVHTSRMSKKYIKHPSEVVSVGDIIKVWVVNVDLKRGRVELSMVNPAQ